jgi:heme/copper-type cytochrome/quinol oxidase subunit 3
MYTTDVFEGVDPAVRARTKKMLMYFIIFAVVMMFAGFTSAYIVLNMGKFWVHADAPEAFWWSLLFLGGSSVAAVLAVRQMRAGSKPATLVSMAAMLALGVAFTLSQSAGWKHLAELGLGFTITPTESGQNAYRWNSIKDLVNGPATYGDDYVVTINGEPLRYDPVRKDFFMPDDTLMAQAITPDVTRTSNLGGGMIWVLIAIHILHLVFGFIYLVVNGIRVLQGTIHAGDTVRLQTMNTYWHFLGILWLYLFGFLFLLN